MDPLDGWQAHILDTPDGFMHDTRTIALFRRLPDGDTEVIIGITETGSAIVKRFAPAVVWEDPLPQLPAGALAALAEAVKPGPSLAELARLEDALTVERGRVDLVLGTITATLTGRQQPPQETPT